MECSLIYYKFYSKTLHVMTKPYSLLLPLVLLLTGCGIYGRYERPKAIKVDGIYRTENLDDTITPQEEGTLMQLSWQEVFIDPSLQTLIHAALERNVDLKTAQLNVEKAQAGLLTAGLSFAPNLGFAPQAQRSYAQGSGWTDQNAYSLPLTASWEIDLSGRLLNSYRQSVSQARMAEERVQLVRTNIISAVANLYYTLQMLDQQLAISLATRDLWAENVRVMRLLKETGNMTEAAVAQSEAQSAQINVTISGLEAQVRSTENALSLLLHQPAQAIERSADMLDYSHLDLNAGLPIQLLSARPDIRIAEENLAAAYYDTAQARSSFLPSVRLTANGSWTNSIGQVIVDPMKFVANIIGSLTQPIFNNGRNIAQLRAARATQEQAALSYQQSILAAGVEVSDALYQLQSQHAVLMSRDQQVESLERALQTTRALMNLSNVNYLEVISAQQQLLSAQLGRAADRLKLAQSVITLYKALGGGRVLDTQEK